MTTKLTLTLEESVIDQAKKYAAESGKSLSDIVESYLKSLSTKKQAKTKFSPLIEELRGSAPLPTQEISTPSFSSKVSKLKGILPVDENFDYKKMLAEELTKKHLDK
ncbi:MAG: DUF6364 family protein [Bacteroidota bacterium]